MNDDIEYGIIPSKYLYHDEEINKIISIWLGKKDRKINDVLTTILEYITKDEQDDEIDDNNIIFKSSIWMVCMEELGRFNDEQKKFSITRSGIWNIQTIHKELVDDRYNVKTKVFSTRDMIEWLKTQVN